MSDPAHPVETAAIPGWRVVVSPDGTSLAAAQLDGAFALWDLGLGHPVRRATITGVVSYRRFAFSPDGTVLAAGGDGNRGTVELYSTATSARLAVLSPAPGTVITQIGASDR